VEEVQLWTPLLQPHGEIGVQKEQKISRSLGAPASSTVRQQQTPGGPGGASNDVFDFGAHNGESLRSVIGRQQPSVEEITTLNLDPDSKEGEKERRERPPAQLFLTLHMLVVLMPLPALRGVVRIVRSLRSSRRQ